LAKQAELKAKGVTDVITYCVNDGAVMKAWAADQKTDNSMIKMLGDPRSEVTQALGLVLDHPGPMSVLGNDRCKRFSMFIDDGIIKTINVAEAEDDPAGDANPTATLVEQMLKDIPDLEGENPDEVVVH
jgi:peroxiredoxin